MSFTEKKKKVLHSIPNDVVDGYRKQTHKLTIQTNNILQSNDKLKKEAWLHFEAFPIISLLLFLFSALSLLGWCSP